jgi:hypothetical protein
VVWWFGGAMGRWGREMRILAGGGVVVVVI